MRSTMGVSVGVAALLVVVTACASSPSPRGEMAEAPHGPTLAAIRPKLDSIETRIGMQASVLTARLDTLRALLNTRTPAPASDDSLSVTESQALRSDAAPEGVITGVVLDGVTGLPLEAAMVYLEGSDIGAIVDATGHFEIARIPLGEYEVVAQRIGYRPVRLRADMRQSEGVVARYLLQPHTLVDCEVISVRGVRVRVRDVLTGKAPPTATALRVSNDSDRWWALATAEEDADVLTLWVQVGAGPLDIEVAAEGYAPWYGRSVPSGPSRCGGPGGGVFDVWLLPTEDHTWRREEGRDRDPDR